MELLQIIKTPIPAKERVIDPDWRCKQSGDCCSIPAEVVMTKLEAKELTFYAPKEITLQFREVDDKFVALKAHPCPLFVFGGCLVYAHRPFNCRRFACMRPDPQTEPYETGGPLGCKNLSDRLNVSRAARRLAEHIQHKAQRWARTHGWL